MNIDHFVNKANDYEQDKDRVENVENIANTILREIEFNQAMHIMDFGSGTGLLLERIAPQVRKITAVDISKSMIKQLADKRSRIGCEIEILEMDLEKSKISQKFDGIISSMTMHHIKDLKSMFMKFYSMLEDNGFIAISDLDLEDGSFHTEDTGVFHLGFDRNELAKVAVEVGFRQVNVLSASIVHKPQGDFQCFLLTGYR